MTNTAALEVELRARRDVYHTVVARLLRVRSRLLRVARRTSDAHLRLLYKGMAQGVSEAIESLNTQAKDDVGDHSIKALCHSILRALDE